MSTQTVAEYLFEDYLHQPGGSFRRPSVEEGHNRTCLTSSMKAALENMRDAEGMTDFDFQIWVQEGGPLALAFDYLNESCLSDCLCPPVYEEDRHYLHINWMEQSTGKQGSDVMFVTVKDAVGCAEELLFNGIAVSSKVSIELDNAGTTATVWMSR